MQLNENTQLQLVIAHKHTCMTLSFLFPDLKQINVSEGNLPRRLAISKKGVLHRTNKINIKRERKLFPGT
jgi:hypothetical protein